MSSKPKTLCTAWNYPGQSTLVIPGNKRSTLKIAARIIGGNPRLLKGYEEFWSDRELKSLQEYES